MLRFGFFEDFRDRETLLIWGDVEGMFLVRDMFARLATGVEKHAALNALNPAGGRRGLTVVFELGEGDIGSLHVDRRAQPVAIQARFSATQFAEFADKVGVLAEPTRSSGHHYLDWPDMKDIQIVVSINEYAENFGESQ